MVKVNKLLFKKKYQLHIFIKLEVYLDVKFMVVSNEKG